MHHRWAWAAASCIGTSHIKSATRLQDAYYCASLQTKSSEFLVVVVSDGAGSASYGGEGASIVCRSLSKGIRRYLAEFDRLPEATEIDSFLDAVRDRIYLAATKREVAPREFAATLVMLITNGTNSLFAHIGDGCAVVYDKDSETWIAPSWPDHGEYASTTFFVTDEPIPKLRTGCLATNISVVVVFSDGIERLALDFSSKLPHTKFFDAIAKPVQDSLESGRNTKICSMLKSYLASENINSRTDDDKTLVIAAVK